MLPLRSWHRSDLSILCPFPNRQSIFEDYGVYTSICYFAVIHSLYAGHDCLVPIMHILCHELSNLLKNHLLRICELAHCLCICHSCYVVAVVGYGNPSFLFVLPRSFDASILLSGVIAAIVQVWVLSSVVTKCLTSSQSFYVERVRMISRKLIIPIFCWFLTALRLIMTVLLTVEATRTSLHRFETRWKWLCASTLAIGSSVDLFVAVLLSYHLRVIGLQMTHRRSAPHRSTPRIGIFTNLARTLFLIDKITAWTIRKSSYDLSLFETLKTHRRNRTSNQFGWTAPANLCKLSWTALYTHVLNE